METQNRRLLSYLKRHRTIDPLTAWRELGIYRLGARIFDLREAGIEIVSDRAPIENRFGEKVSVALYRLAA